MNRQGGRGRPASTGASPPSQSEGTDSNEGSGANGGPTNNSSSDLYDAGPHQPRLIRTDLVSSQIADVSGGQLGGSHGAMEVSSYTQCISIPSIEDRRSNEANAVDLFL